MPTQSIVGAPWDLQGAVCWTAGAQGPEQPGGEHQQVSRHRKKPSCV